MKPSGALFSADEWQVLLFAAGVVERLPSNGICNPSQLLKGLATHRLGSRLLRRLKQHPVEQSPLPSWLSPEFWTHLRGQNAKTGAEIEMRVQAAREINTAFTLSTALGEDASFPLIIKGFAAHAATGDAAYQRPSADLDLLTDKPEHLLHVLTSLGYECLSHGDKTHEYASASRTSLSIEIHDFFPIYSFPSGIKESRFSWQGSGLQIQTFSRPSRRDLLYGDLRPHAVPDQLPLRYRSDRNILFVPDITTTVFMLCAHEFREWIHSPLEVPTPVRLAVLADIYELASRREFDAARFQELTQNFGGTDSVHFIGTCLGQIWSHNPLPIKDEAKQRIWPRQLGGRGGWIGSLPVEEWISHGYPSLLNELPSTLLHPAALYSPVVDPFSTLPTLQLHWSMLHLVDETPPSLSITPSLQRSRIRVIESTPKNEFLLEVSLPPLANPDSSYRIRLDSREGCFYKANITHSSERNFEVHREALNQPSIKIHQTARLLLTINERRDDIRDFFDATQLLLIPLDIAELFKRNDCDTLGLGDFKVKCL